MRIKTLLAVGGLSCAVAAAVVLATVDETGSGVAGSGGRVILVGDDDRDDSRDDDGDELVASPPGGRAFELEIDPELDARFGPRPVNAVQAAVIVTDRFGGDVVEAELDEAGGRPIWEMELEGAAVDKVDVDALNGAILSGGDD